MPRQKFKYTRKEISIFNHFYKSKNTVLTVSGGRCSVPGSIRTPAILPPPPPTGRSATFGSAGRHSYNVKVALYMRVLCNRMASIRKRTPWQERQHWSTRITNNIAIYPSLYYVQIEDKYTIYQYVNNHNSRSI